MRLRLSQPQAWDWAWALAELGKKHDLLLICLMKQIDKKNKLDQQIKS